MQSIGASFSFCPGALKKAMEILKSKDILTGIIINVTQSGALLRLVERVLYQKKITVSIGDSEHGNTKP